MKLVNRVALGGAVLALVGLIGAASATTLIVVRADGSASVKVGDQTPVVISASCVSTLNQQLAGATTPEAVRRTLATTGCCAPDDERLAAAVAAYAMTLVPPELGDAVVEGTLQCNPNAGDELETAAGPAGPAPTVASIIGLGVGGLGGGGTQELRRGGSPTGF